MVCILQLFTLPENSNRSGSTLGSGTTFTMEEAMKFYKAMMISAMCVLAMLLNAGCGKKGSAGSGGEKEGKITGVSVEKAKASVRDSINKVSKKAQDSINKTSMKAQDSVKKAEKKAQDSATKALKKAEDSTKKALQRVQDSLKSIEKQQKK